MAIFNKTNYDEKVTPADADAILLSDSEDSGIVKYGLYSKFKGAKGDTGNAGATGATGPQGPAGANGPAGPAGPQGVAGPQGPDGEDGTDGNGIASITTNKVGKTTTVTITEDDSTVTTFDVEDGADGEGAGDMLLDGVQSVTGAKTFDKDKLLVKGTSTGTTNLTTANTSANNYTATFPAKDGTVAMTVDLPDITGKVDKSTYDANTILKADSDNTPAALTVGEQTLVGRKTGGVITALTPTEVRTMINVADGAIANPMTTAGDIIYGGTDGVATRLAKGTAGQVLKMNTGATAPEWGSASGGGTSLWTAITGTRASNTTITVATDLTAIFKKGMIVRRQESGVDKVGMVSIPSTYSSPNTTITIIGDTCASIDTDTFKYSSIIGAEQFIKNFAIAGTIGATGTDVANAYYANEPYRVIGAEISAGTVASNSGNTTANIVNGTGPTTLVGLSLAYNALTNTTPTNVSASALSLALNDRVQINITGVCTTTFHTDLYIKLYLLPTRYLSLS